MAVAKNPELQALPERIKDALKLLHQYFDLDWNSVVVVSGDVYKAGERMAAKRAEQYKVVEARIAAYNLTATPAPPKSGAPVVVSCRFKTDDYVRFADGRNNELLQVARVVKRDFGRTGFWCALKYPDTGLKYGKAEIESAYLVGCEAPEIVI